MPSGATYHASAELAASLRSVRPTIDVQSAGGEGGGGEGEVVVAVQVVAYLLTESALRSPSSWWSSQRSSPDL